MRQQGYVTLIFAIMLLTMVGGAVAFLVEINAAAITDTADQENRLKALYLAESGVEHAVAEYSAGGGGQAVCETTLDAVTANVGDGSFILSTGAGAFDVATGFCTVQVTGQAGNYASHTIQAEISHAASGTDFTDRFPDDVDWSAFVPVNNGSNSGSASLSADSATADGTSSLYFTTPGTAGKPNDTLAGYREKSLTPFYTGPTPMTITISLAYQKEDVGSQGMSYDVSLSLVDAAGNATVLWSNSTPDTAGNWISVGSGTPYTFDLPAATTFNRVRVDVNLRQKKKQAVRAWIDDIVLSAGGGGSGSLLVSWEEVIN